MSREAYALERRKAEAELERRRLMLEPGERAELIDCGAQIAIQRNDGSVRTEPTPNYRVIKG